MADLLEQLNALSDEQGASSSTPQPSTQTATATSGQGDDDVSFALDDIQKQLAAKSSQQTSRPITPRLSSSTTSGTTNNRSPKRAHTPASSGAPSERNSEERGRTGNTVGLGVGAGSTTAPRTSGEGRSYHQGYVPTEDAAPVQQQQEKMTSAGGGGGWWGSMFSAATMAVNQAQTLAKEIRQNEELQQRVRGYGAGLQNLTTDLRTRALPTFNSLVSHIAPPISAHERLSIHATHDIINYPSLDPLIYATFSRVMAQVEGGDLLVIQRGSENRSRSASSEEGGYRGSLLSGGGSGGGWTDGPWWRDDMSRRDLGVVAGLKEGTRLARVSAESYAKEYFDARGGVEEASRIAAEGLSESNPVRKSDIFLAIQAISYPSSPDLFAGDAREASKEKDTNTTIADEDAEEGGEDQIAFAIYLHDPLHSLSFSTLSQSFPQKWAVWLDAPASPNTNTTSPSSGNDGLPDSILEIISAGGVDPREWIAEWMEETLSLSVGVVAQNYVARRMGVGDGGLGRGRRRVGEEEAAGEAARAL